ncbi:hypothetical protein KP509_27G011300 [Ceratopteris richardii]|uniref:Trimethylguanosine synthase n=1 Tax=Ceratopteris richardii TaxID=49495 RepID=A0A8T2RDU8_CERRI|nr:hypothetical protein KP509_27G011300 [Ceratopteris richardii]KAH7294646.1 hypothetical protein KP509_27G011300 [Ceratopteris richardii]
MATEQLHGLNSIKEITRTYHIGEIGRSTRLSLSRAKQLKHVINTTLRIIIDHLITTAFKDKDAVRSSVPGLCDQTTQSIEQDIMSCQKVGKQDQQSTVISQTLADLDLNVILDENGRHRVILPGMEEEGPLRVEVVKYWKQRHSLFSRWDEGIRVDEESLFSVTPQEIAEHQALRCCCGRLGDGSGLVVVDAFAGVGGNTIQFASRNFHVISIDIDPKKSKYARRNAEIYGVSERIEFIVGDFLELAPTLKADIVFLSPPWGGPQYIKAEKYDIETMLQPVSGSCLFKLASLIAPNVVFFLPKTCDLNQLAHLSLLSQPSSRYTVEWNYVKGELKALTAYYGDNIAN